MSERDLVPFTTTNPSNPVMVSPPEIQADWTQGGGGPSAPSGPDPLDKVFDAPDEQPVRRDVVGEPSPNRGPSGNPKSLEEIFSDTPVNPLPGVHQEVKDIPPQDASDIVTLSNKLGEPPEVIAGNLEEARKAAKAPHPQFLEDLNKNYPGTTKWLTEPKNMAVAQHDLPNLRDHEELFKNTVEARNWLETLQGGLQHSVLGVAIETLMEEAGLTPKDKSLAPKTVLPKDAGVTDRLLFGAGSILGDTPLFAAGGGVGGALAPQLATVGAFALQGAAKKAVEDQYRKGNITGARNLLDRALDVYLAGIKGGAVGAVVGFAGEGASALVPKTLPLAVAETAKFVAEAAVLPTAGKFVENGKIEAPSAEEFIDSLLLIGALHVGGAAASSFFKAARGPRGATEARVEKDVTPEKPLQLQAGGEEPPRPTEPVTPTPSPFPDLKTKNANEMLDALDVLAQKSKLREINPEAYRDYLTSVTKGTPLENVYVPAEALETYAQSNKIDLGKTLEALGVKEQFQDAKDTGGSLKISTPDFIVGMEEAQRKALRPDLKFDSEDLTQNELDERKKEYGEKVKLAEKQAKEGSKTQESLDAIKNDVATQISSLGEFPEQYVNDVAETFTRRFEARARIMGEDPKDLYDRRGYKFLSGDGAMPPGQTLNQAAPNIRRVDDKQYSYEEVLASAHKTGNNAEDAELGERYGNYPKNERGRTEFDKPPTAPRPTFSLVEVPVGLLFRGGRERVETPSDQMFLEASSEDEKWAQKYAKLPADTAEPILVMLKDGAIKILDGRHRSRAAFLRGESHVKAFIESSQLEQIMTGGPLFQSKLPAVTPQLSPLGFFSQVEAEVQKMDFKEMPAKDLLNRIQNIQGLKKEELNEMGLLDWLRVRDAEAQNGPITHFEVTGKDGLTVHSVATQERAKQLADEYKNKGIEVEVRQVTDPNDGRVTKEEVLDFIRSNGLPVTQKVLSSDFDDGESGDVIRPADLVWGERTQLDGDPYGENASSEYDYYVRESDEPIEQYPEEWKAFLEAKGLTEKKFKDLGWNEKGDLKSDFVTEDRSRVERFQEMANESVNSEDSIYAVFRYEEEKTGWTLEGNDERGWYSPETGNHYETSLEEAKVKLVRQMIKKGEVKGTMADAIQPTDVKFADPEFVDEVDEYEVKDGKGHTLNTFDSKREANAAIKKGEFGKKKVTVVKTTKEETRSYRTKRVAKLSKEILKERGPELQAKAKTAFEPWELDDGQTEPNEAQIKEKAKSLAKEEAYKLLDDPSTGGRIEAKLDTAGLKGKIRGSIVDGFSLVMRKAGEEVSYPLTSKTLPEARTESVKTLQDNGFVAKEEAQPAQGGINTPTGATQYERHVSPVGKEYYEIQIRLPSVSPAYTAGHYGERNVLLHILATVTDDENGKKTLAVKEMQSDWMQQAREWGFKGDTVEGQPDSDKAVPKAPFSQTDAWANLGLKRLIRFAVEQGYDAIALPFAKDINNRWGTDELVWEKKKGGNYEIVGPMGRQVAEFETEAMAKEAMAKNEDAEAEGYRVQKVPDHWLVYASEQRGGRFENVDIEEEARRRGLLKDRGQRVTSQAELKALIEATIRGPGERSAESIAKSVWAKMEGGEDGIKRPRKEGMEFFYDNLLPKKLLPKLLKKLDPTAKIETKKLFFKGQGFDHYFVELTDNLKSEVQKGLPLFQEGQRGSITFLPKETIIRLMKGKDFSTLVHESGHDNLQMMGEDVKALSAKDPASLTPEQTQFLQDAKETLDFMGADSFDKINTEQHEKFARAAERYFWEGFSPSEALRRVFERFKKLLKAIYKDARELNVELTDKMREVFDRMYAADAEIEEARAKSGMKTDTTGLDPEVAKRITSIEERARAQAEQALLREQMKDTALAHREAYDKSLKEAKERAKVQTLQEPLYAAIEDLASGRRKTAADLANRFLEDRVTDEVAAGFEAAAEVHGFTSGEELAQLIIQDDELNGFEAEVQKKVDAEMAKYADLKDTDQIKVDAMKFIHEERMTELLGLEKQILDGMLKKANTSAEVTRRNQAEARVAAQAARDQAKEILSKKPLRDAGNAGIYISQERKAAMAAQKAMVKKDWAEASNQKELQMVNHALVREAMMNREQAEKSVKYLTDRFVKRGRDLGDMPYAFTRQIDKLLTSHGFMEDRPEDVATLTAIAKDLLAKGQEPGDIANQTGLVEGPTGWESESLDAFVQRVNESYYALSLPDGIRSVSKSDYRDLKMAELNAVTDFIKSVADIGKKYDRFLGEFKELEIRQAAELFALQIQENIGTPYSEKLKVGSPFDSKFAEILDSTLNLPQGVAPLMVNMLTLSEYLDKKALDGLAKTYIYRPIKSAEDRKLVRLQKAHEALDAILQKYYTPKEFARFANDRYLIPEFGGQRLTKEQILSIALNWGNEGNRDRIVRGFKVESSRVEAVLFRHLEKRDFDFAQEVGNYLDTFWPEVVALEQKVNGVTPRKVEVTPVDTPWGTYKGWYYPLDYDASKSAMGLIHAEQRNELYKMMGAAKAHTDTGHTVQRVSQLDRPVRLSLGVLFNHIENVVHDLEFRPAIIDLQRFLMKTKVRTALEQAIDVKGYKMVNDWLKSVAADQGEYLTQAEKVLKWLRFKLTFSTLAWKAVNLPLDLVGNTINVTHEMVSRTDRPSLSEFIANPSAMHALASEKSIRMRRRAELRDRDLMDLANKWNNRDSWFKTFAYFFQSAADEAVSVPLWNAVYKHHLATKGEKAAIDLADEAVTRTFGSGTRIDQVAVQQGSEWQKITSMFYGFASTMFNRSWLEGKMAGLEYKAGNSFSALAIMARAVFFLWFAQAANEIIQREFFRNIMTERDDDEVAKRAAGRFLTQPLGYVWLARDIGGYAVERALGNKLGGYRLSPMEQALETVLKPAADTLAIAFSEDRKFDAKYWEESARAASVLLGYPQKMNDLAFNLLDDLEGNGEANWRDLLNRKVKK